METKKTLIIVLSIIAVMGIGIKFTSIITAKRAEAAVGRLMEQNIEDHGTPFFEHSDKKMNNQSKDSTIVSRKYHLKYVYNPNFMQIEEIDDSRSQNFFSVGNDDISLSLSAYPETKLNGLSIYDPEVTQVIHKVDGKMENMMNSEYPNLITAKLVSSCKKFQNSNGIDFYRSEFKCSYFGVPCRQIMYFFVNNDELQQVLIQISDEYLNEHPNVETELINNLYILP